MKKILYFIILFIPVILYAQITYNVPEILYLKFNNGSVTTPNYANPGSGCPSARIFGMIIGNGGMFDSCLIGQDLNSDISYTENRWATYLPSSGWSIGFWISDLSVPPVGTNPVYLLGEGDPGADNFRCFWAGSAIGSSDTGVALRKGSTLNCRVPVPTNGASYLHFVYDPVAGTVRGYRNGQLKSTVSQASMVIAGNGPFKVAGHLTFPSLSTGMKMDEFRVYNRVLSDAEIAATWNHTLPYTITGIVKLSGNLPVNFRLYQNYPNPFNPVTKIKFAIPELSGESKFEVNLSIYDQLGQMIEAVIDKELQAGEYETQFDGSNYSSGIYYYRISVLNNGIAVGEYSESKTMVLIK